MRGVRFVVMVAAVVVVVVVVVDVDALGACKTQRESRIRDCSCNTVIRIDLK